MPYQIKIKPIQIENVMDSLIKNPFFVTDDNGLARSVGRNLNQLRKDKKLIIANDKRTGETYLALRKSPLALPDGVLKTRGQGRKGRVSYEFEDFWFL